MIVIIMAGGMGKRMESELPKVLHEVIDPNNLNMKLPMIVHVLLRAIELKPKEIFVIVGKFRDIISETININIKLGIISETININYVDQPNPMGTAHAISCVIPLINSSSYASLNAIILSGDVPLISSNTLEKLIDKNSNKILVTELDNPFGCGRILTDLFTKKIIGIREEKDCNDEEKNISCVNCGIYQIKISTLIKLLPLITNNNKSQEYYLTDIIGLMITNNIPIETCILKKESQWEIKNVNTKNDLILLNKFVKNMYTN